MILWLIRHPRTAVPAGVCYGKTDVSIAPRFTEEAAELIGLVRKDGPDAVYSSPLKRCRLLADLIGPAQLDARLRELDFGRWEMQPWSSIDRVELDCWRDSVLHWRIPGGESVGELAGRVAAFLADLRRSVAGRVCVVTHAGVIRILACLLWRQDLVRALDVAVPLGSALRVEWQGDRARLLDLHRFGEVRPPAWVR